MLEKTTKWEVSYFVLFRKYKCDQIIVRWDMGRGMWYARERWEIDANFEMGKLKRRGHLGDLEIDRG